MRAVGTGSTGSRLTRERSGSVIRGHTKRSPRSVGKQETRTHDDDSSRNQWVSGVLADESEKKRTGSFDTTSLVEARLRLVRNAFVSRALSQRRLLSFKSGHELRS